MLIQPALKRCSAFANVPPQVTERLARVASLRTYRHAEQLWRAGDMPRSLAIIRAGLVKVVREGYRGRSAICGLFGPIEAIGIVPLLKGVPLPANAIVATDTAQVILIPREEVLENVKAHPAFAISLACSMHAKIAALHDKIDVLSAGAVESRLATALLKLYERFGDDFDDGTSSIPISLSRRELSDLVSTSFETAIRIMTRWEREGVIITESKGFTIRNKAALEAISSSSSVTRTVAAE